jgi:hypothetical protein
MNKVHEVLAQSIFLSHSSTDKPFVRRLAERLTESGVRVWLDEAQLQVGDSLIDKISEAIRGVDFVVAVISKHSLKSPWAKKELSLAITKEIKGQKVVVLPALIDDCEVPASLEDKVYADFRDPQQFDQAANKLLRAMGVTADRRNYRSGIAIEWTEEGARIFGHGVTISPTESNALLDRWHEWLPKFIDQESKRGRSREEAGPAAHLLAVIRACADTYNRVPSEDEMKAGTSELSRKFDLLYLFFDAMYEEAMHHGSGTTHA